MSQIVEFKLRKQGEYKSSKGADQSNIPNGQTTNHFFRQTNYSVSSTSSDPTASYEGGQAENTNEMNGYGHDNGAY